MKHYSIHNCSENPVFQNAFEELINLLYSKDSLRHQMGNDPSPEFLEGKYVVICDGAPVGRFALYENPNLELKGQPAMSIGSYECTPDEQVCSFLWANVKVMVKQKGFNLLIGPMEGSTWNNYRFNLENESPPFFMEPSHHTYYNNQFKMAGFKAIATYFSQIEKQFSVDESALLAKEQAFKNKGIRFRNFDGLKVDEELRRIGTFSLEGFANNFLYTPISLDAFVAKYKALVPYIDPNLVWIGEDENEEIDMLIFALHDHFDPEGKTMIIKSLARRKKSKHKGVAGYLVGKMHQIALQYSYEKVIHAFMYEDNVSMEISNSHGGAIYQRYALYALTV